MDNSLNQPVSPNPQEVPNPVVQPVAQALQTPPISSIPQSPPLQTIVSKPKKGSKMKMIIILVIALVILVGLGFLGYSYFKTANTYNAGVYNYPTSVPATPTPTDILNPNDTSDASIDSNNQVVDQNLNSLDSDLNSVTDSLNDKQTNLQ